MSMGKGHPRNNQPRARCCVLRYIQQYQQVNFDALTYLEMVKRYNGYQEKPPIKTVKAGKISHRVKPDQIKTFDDDDEEDEDDGDAGEV